MFIKKIKVSGLLSFGPEGMDLPLGNLNVLIGPNGSGKSNLLEILALLRAAPTNLPLPVKEMGGVREWLWKGVPRTSEATVEGVFEFPRSIPPLRHSFTVTEHGGRFEVVDESIENERPMPGYAMPLFYYRFQRGFPVLKDMLGQERQLQRVTVKPEQSVLSQIRDPEHYPTLTWLQEQYEQIALFRNWSFGPSASLRREQSAHERGDFLTDGGDNLALVLSNVGTRVKLDFLSSLKKLYEGIEDFALRISGGNVLLYLIETGGREIPATRLSDGTLRYLCLLTILLHPEPPPLIALEEPELGLHPDVIPHIGELLMRASQHTQLVVTTHSRVLVDALSADPSSVIVCEKTDANSRFQRLDPDDLALWLDKYSLGELWSMGELGGNRW